MKRILSISAAGIAMGHIITWLILPAFPLLDALWSSGSTLLVVWLLCKWEGVQ